jgi:transposase
MESTTIGIDLAKNVFSICVMNDKGQVTQRLELKRDALADWLRQREAGTIVAMEACSSAHYWARFCQQHDLRPRLMAAQFVKPFRKSSAIKNDRHDAEAIATAARQGNMRFVAVKTVEQQARLSWHRVRDGYKKDALAVTNRIRGLLAEFGIVISKSKSALRRALEELKQLDLPPAMIALIQLQQQYWAQIEAQKKQCDEQIQAQAEADERCQRIRALSGVGPLTADAIVASIGNAQDFKNGRQCAAWLGLTPSQHGTGGRVLLGRISCRGDSYLRSLLIQGARSSLQRAKVTPEAEQTPEQKWIVQLATRLPFGKVLAAIANKHARQIWAMLARGEAYDPEAWLKHPMVQRG